MLIDYSKTPQLPAFDVCIIGAGPAGITLATKLQSTGWKIGLIEAGGLEFSEKSQSMYQTESVGRNLYAESTRLRYFGGTSNHWSGRCRPFVPDDFKPDHIGDLPGWPITFDEFNRYLPEAMKIVDLPESGFFKTPTPPFTGNEFEHDEHALSPPTRFATKYLQEIQQAANITLVLNCNLVDLALDPASGKVTQAVVSDYEKKRSPIKAKAFVLAMGAIENSRLLLNSASLMSLAELKAMVGVGFMEHMNVEMGKFILRGESDWDSGGYFTSAAFVEEQHIGRGNVTFGVLQEIKSYGRTAKIKTFLKGLACRMELTEKIQFLQSINCPGQGVITTLLEQAPLKNGSRISLSDQTDALGLKKARVNWIVSDDDIRTIRTIGKEAAKAFARSGLGLVKLHPYMYNDGEFIPLSPHAHHMGGTRMSATPAGGVVDTNLKVFGTKNLYVTGSSVFPTGGGGNPTMPLIQLTLRLAEHLQSKR